MKKSVHSSNIYYKNDRKLSDCGNFLYVKKYKNKKIFLDVYEIEEIPHEPREFYDYKKTIEFSKSFWKALSR